MPISYPPESEHAQEVVKWEAFPTAFGAGKRPYVFRPFPNAIYKAKRVDAQIVLDHDEVNSADELANRQSLGWSASPQEAVDALLAADLEVAHAAANRAFHEQRMSPNAQAEAAAAADAHPGHLGSVPVTPIRKRGRPVKVRAATV